MLIYQVVTLGMMAWFVWHLGQPVKHEPTTDKPTTVWLLAAILLAVLLWILDQWMITILWDFDQGRDIQQWQASQQNFWMISVVISTVCLTPWLEEWLFRGCLFRGLMTHLSSWLAAMISAIAFALIHWQWPAFISLLVAGLMYAWLTLKSGRLLPAVLAHMTHNALTLGLYSLS